MGTPYMYITYANYISIFFFFLKKGGVKKKDQVKPRGGLSVSVMVEMERSQGLCLRGESFREEGSGRTWR